MGSLKPKETFIKTVKKIWGFEFWVVNAPQYCMKFLYLKPGGCSSLHYHNVKDETFFVDIGSCILELEGKILQLMPGDSINISHGQKHRFSLPPSLGFFETGCMIIEASTHHDDEDVVRLEESKVFK